MDLIFGGFDIMSGCQILFFNEGVAYAEKQIS